MRLTIKKKKTTLIRNIYFKTLNQLKASGVNGSLGQNYFHHNTKMYSVLSLHWHLHWWYKCNSGKNSPGFSNTNQGSGNQSVLLVTIFFTCQALSGDRYFTSKCLWSNKNINFIKYKLISKCLFKSLCDK